ENGISGKCNGVGVVFFNVGAKSEMEEGCGEGRLPTVTLF
ncbi:18436_t:CDS:1, partial [Entrophospora sp. SA101]